ncbi:DUF1552 domain-containing protein [Pirellulaceae bacterium SH467]|jgi:hypothetical protein
MKRLNRRHILRGAGVALALPYLDAMSPSAVSTATAAESKFRPRAESTIVQPRVLFCYVPNGVNILEWQPKEVGENYALSPTLKVLESIRDDFTVVSGLGHPRCTGGHSGADTWLTGADLRSVPGKDYANSLSVDQLIAESLGTETRFPSQQWSDQSGTGSAGHSHTLSFDRNGTPLPAEDSPKRIFERLFVPESAGDREATLRRYAERRSVLDNVLEESKRLARRIGKEDQRKLDEYLGSVRSTEQRIERLESWIDRPKPTVDPTLLQLAMQPHNAHDRPMWIDVMLELAYLSFITDSTRVISFEWSREAGGFGGGGENHHELSHHGGDPGMLEKLATIDRFHLERLKRFLAFLRQTRESDGSMLDRTVVVFGSGMNSGEGGDHSPKNLPLLVVGGSKLGLRHNRHIHFETEKSPPLSNLLLELTQRIGIETDSFSDATGAGILSA